MGPGFDPSAFGYEGGLFSIDDVWRRYLRSMDAIERCRQHLSNIESYLLILTICQIILILLASALLFVRLVNKNVRLC